jgi:hypothetical protein
MKFTLTSVVALFAAQALASAIAEPVAADHDMEPFHKICHPKTETETEYKTKTVTEYKWRFRTKTYTETETETETEWKTKWYPKKIYKTTTVYQTSTTTKKRCPKKWDH